MKWIICFLFSPFLSFAHPGIGIVCDSKGNIYYTDLEQVWKIDKTGNRSVAVSNVHSHELFIDSLDNLYGEHTWYNGERLNTWGHYVWRYNSTGKLDTVVSPTSGFLTNYSFVRDDSGNMYWIDKSPIAVIKKITPDGVETVIASGKFENIRWSYCTKNGVLYFIDIHKLYKLTADGSFKLITSHLDDDPSDNASGRQHHVFGIWDDKAGNIYVAILSGKHVKRISPSGKIDIITPSQAPWGPTGGVFDKEGNLHLLEVSDNNKVRVRKISSSDLSDQSVVAISKPKSVIPLITVGFLISILLLAIVLKKKNQKSKLISLAKE